MKTVSELIIFKEIIIKEKRENDLRPVWYASEEILSELPELATEEAKETLRQLSIDRMKPLIEEAERDDQKKKEDQALKDEIKRLVDAKDLYFKMFPVVSDANILRKRKRRFITGEQDLTTEEVRKQEKHWMQMWKDAKDELRKLRDELRLETDESVRAELMVDIEGLKGKKDEWAKLLGLNEQAII